MTATQIAQLRTVEAAGGEIAVRLHEVADGNHEIIVLANRFEDLSAECGDEADAIELAL